MYDLSYAGHQFERALGLQERFRDTPRFGRTNDFAALFDDNKRSEYVSGVLVIALIFECVFLTWAIGLCFLKCMGKQRVGFLSGAPYEATLGDNNEPSPRPMRGRIVFGVFGMIFITFTFLLIFLGIANLEETTTELSDGAKLGSDIFVDSRGLLGQFLETAEAAATARDLAVNTLQEAFETGNITLADGTTIDLANRTLPPALVAEAKYVYNDINFREEAAQVIDKLYALDDFIQEPASELSSVIDDGQDTCDSVSDGLDDVSLRALQMIYGIPYTVVPFFMVVLMVLTAMGVNNSGKDWCTSLCFVPFFIILVLLLIIFTGAYSVGGIMNADFCSGGTGTDLSPDYTVIAIMDTKGIDPLSLEYRVMQYLVSGCEFDTPEDEFPLLFIEEFESVLRSTEESLGNFTIQLESVGIQALTQNLGHNITRVREQVDTMKEKSDAMVELLVEVIKELACQRLYEVYEKVFHDATCDKSYYGLVWSFSSFLVMSLCGMMMVTFRAVLYPVVGKMDDYSWNEVKEQEDLKDGTPDEVLGTNVYVQDEGIKDSNTKGTDAPTEAPMGGQAQQAYDTVGDDNPFAEHGDTDTYQPKKSSWE